MTQSQDPGKVLTIIGFIMAFFPLQLIGLILSIIGLSQSRKAGHKNGLAIAGIVLNSVFLIIFPILAVITIVAYNGITTRANTNSAKASASSILKYSEIYNTESGKYPITFNQLADYGNSFTNIFQATSSLNQAPDSPSTVEFYSCGPDVGNKIGYWNYSDRAVAYLYSGEAEQYAVSCVLTSK